ncbi:hypothetical protein [Companilactobacillus futsaii]|uniref:Type II secretion system protein n=2 Tax=Companilactobacillus futsaii TaxID=938155 RepID=A0A5B7SZH8_9LACO|nr:hypothetical protein [Companilactobacillus futsaii]KRK94915.1 hypothetical protein FC88_GL000040 [Companilactobacillus futsaii JCM 17355]QCX25207.1 hypothetical protein FG051_08810 [Companilactobacillus futsaii]
MKQNREGFVLAESLVALSISVLIIFTLTYCVKEEFKVIDHWEERVNAHKIILLNLYSNNVPNPLIIKNKKYFFETINDGYQVTVNKNVYQIKPTT